MEYAFLKTEMTQHEMILNQLGADVKIVQGIMCYVSIEINGIPVEYVYQINNVGNYFLQRLAPYPMVAGSFVSKDEVINLIKHDISQFKNAANSSAFKDFIEIHKNLTRLARQFEDLYLYYNVPHDALKSMNENLKSLDSLIKECKVTSKRVYTEKDPETV